MNEFEFKHIARHGSLDCERNREEPVSVLALESRELGDGDLAEI